MVMPATGHDVFPPCWRGQPGSTFQEWKFDTNNNPATPEISANPYGMASALVAPNEELGGEGWKFQFAGGGFGTLQSGYWDMGADGMITLTVPNRVGASALAYKYISIQITEWFDPGSGYTNAAVFIPSAAVLGDQTTTIQTVPGSFSWRVNQSLWRLPSSPDSETITLTTYWDPQNLQGGGVIDQIVVDTISLDPAGVISPAGTPAIGSQISCLPMDFGPGGSYLWNFGNAAGIAGMDWDMLSVADALNVSATNNAGPAGKFRVAVVSPPGGTPNFNSDESYQWTIATATSVVGFNPAKFTIDLSDFSELFNGTFSLVLQDTSLLLVYTAPEACEHVTSLGFALQSLAGPPPTTNLVMSFTNLSGISSVQALVAQNCMIHGVTYSSDGSSLGAIGPVSTTLRTLAPGGTTRAVLTATKLVESDPAVVNVLVQDACGRGSSFDPVITSVEIFAGNQVEQRFEGLLAAEHYLYVQNGAPGLARLAVGINGRHFVLNLTDGQIVASDLRCVMLEGNENWVVFTGYGEAGSSALVMLTDTPSGNEEPLQETVLLSLCHGESGLKLSWPATLDGWRLQASARPDAGWDDLTAPPVAENGMWTVTVAVTAGAQYYRLTSSSVAARRSVSIGHPADELVLPSTSFPNQYLFRHEGFLW